MGCRLFLVPSFLFISHLHISSSSFFSFFQFYYFLYLRPLTILSTCIDRLDRCEVRMRLYGSAEHYELCVWTNQDVAFRTVVLLSPPGRLIDKKKNHLTAAKRQHAAAPHEVLKTAKQRIGIKIKCIWLQRLSFFWLWLWLFKIHCVFTDLLPLLFGFSGESIENIFFFFLSWSNAYSYHLTQLDWNQFQFVFTYSQKNAAIFWLSDIAQTKPLLFGPK